MGSLIPDEVRITESSGWGRPRSYPLTCVWLKRLGRERQELRRYSKAEGCVGPYKYHNADSWIGDFKSTLNRDYEGDSTGMIDHKDPRWPTRCGRCDYQFVSTDHWQYNRTRLYSYKGPYGHLVVTIRNCPPGSLYDAKWLDGYDWAIGPDGIALHAVCPNGRHWHVDGQASNCTLPQQVPVPGKPGWTTFVRNHYCWVRHGDPKHPSTLHVDKAGVTCAAGAGSIVAGDYHGFLHYGGFTAG